MHQFKGKFHKLLRWTKLKTCNYEWPQKYNEDQSSFYVYYANCQTKIQSKTKRIIELNKIYYYFMLSISLGRVFKNILGKAQHIK